MRITLAFALAVVGGCSSTDSPSMVGTPPDTGPAPVVPVPPITTNDGGTEPDADAPADAGADADAGSPNVAGTAYYAYYDAPLYNAKLEANGTSAMTDGNGAFSLGSLPATYDLSMSYTVVGFAYLDTWKNVTTRAPIVEAGMQQVGVAFTTEVNGKILGLGTPIPDATMVRVFARSRYGQVTAYGMGGGDPGAFTLKPNWYGASTRDLVVHACTYAPIDNYASSFGGCGEVKVALTDGVTKNDADITLAKTGASDIIGTMSPATGTLGMSVRYGSPITDGAAWTWTKPASASYQFLAPFTGTRYVHLYRSYPNSTLYDFAKEPPLFVHDFAEFGEPVLASPAAAATYAAGMTFSWTAPASSTGGSYVFQLSSALSAPAPAYRERTTATSVTIPAGFVPSAGSYVWSVTYFPKITSVDGFLAGDGTSWSSRRGVSRAITVP